MNLKFSRVTSYFLSRLFFISVFLIFQLLCFGQSVLVKTIYFKSGSFSIDKKYEKSLNLISKKLSSDSFSYLKVFAYTDTIGSAYYNDALSEKRANVVYDYLITHSKFDTTKVYITWLGKSDEGYDLHFPMAHIQQRCVDIWIQFYPKKKHE